jgi:hypothetical protein
MRIILDDDNKVLHFPAYVQMTPDLEGTYAYLESDTIEIADDVDWTLDKSTLRSNSSELFNVLCKEIESVIRSDAFAIVNGRADLTARLIVSQLAHKHKLIPMQFFNEIVEKQNDC